MYELLTTALKDHPNSVAQMYRPEKNDPYKKVTHQEFFEKARAIGLGLDAIGLKRGDKVGFIAGNKNVRCIIPIKRGERL